MATVINSPPSFSQKRVDRVRPGKPISPRATDRRKGPPASGDPERDGVHAGSLRSTVWEKRRLAVTHALARHARAADRESDRGGKPCSMPGALTEVVDGDRRRSSPSFHPWKNSLPTPSALRVLSLGRRRERLPRRSAGSAAERENPRSFSAAE
ncbi:unnamed protein product [Lampetra planeri]